MNRMTVHKDGAAIYDIVMASSYKYLKDELKTLHMEDRKVCIVTDTNVEKLYLSQIKEIFSSCCRQADSFVFSAGEEYKNLNTVKSLYEHLIVNHFDRGDLLVALGGGVVGDLCGYTAATYLRGIRFIQLPTTLLSQVDSSVGGKTGVDFDSYKNMVGAFHMPSLVYTCTSTLLTLSEEQFASGMGEIIKHGLIKNADYYTWLKDNREKIQNRDLDICAQMILESNIIKCDVVEKDPTEQGDRALLNFGHTLGHAIEKLMDFKLLHGQCVALGSIAAAQISYQRGMLSLDMISEIRNTFKSFGLPTSLEETHLDTNQIIAVTKSDKKMDSGTIKFILLKKIGEAYVDRSVNDGEMWESLSLIQGGKS